MQGPYDDYKETSIIKVKRGFFAFSKNFKYLES